MTVSKFFTASLLGAISLSTGVVANRGLSQSDGECPPGTNIAECWAFAFGGAEVTGDTIAEAAANAAAYICDDGTGSADATAVAEATATLIAKATAEASITCVTCGDAAGYGNAEANAVARAKEVLQAYASAFASAQVCNHCEAVTESFAYVEKYVVLEAVASAHATLQTYPDIDSNAIFVNTVVDYNEQVKTAVATAFAQAVANAAMYYDGAGCSAWVNSNICIYTPDHPDPEYCAECTAVAFSDSFEIEIPAIAEASAGAAAITCGDDTYAVADVEVVAKALAEATAIAVSKIYVDCFTEGEGTYACARAETFIEAAAYTIAEAFANAWGVAINCDDKCAVSVETATESFGSAIAAAASSAYDAVCVDNGDSWSVDQFQLDVETILLEAVAEAAALAISSVDETGNALCLAATYSGTSVAPV